MPNSLNRMIKHHPGAGEAHDFADLFSHVFAVAVGWAFLQEVLWLPYLQDSSLWWAYLTISH